MTLHARLFHTPRPLRWWAPWRSRFRVFCRWCGEPVQQVRMARPRP